MAHASFRGTVLRAGNPAVKKGKTQLFQEIKGKDLEKESDPSTWTLIKTPMDWSLLIAEACRPNRKTIAYTFENGFYEHACIIITTIMYATSHM